ncbi:hypothetical protein MUK42_14141 [Musa troglodytarum]|uniref:Uncharacterized protein n=1 Tax=Musa troglodytarum TaxID=320322 RepID=A0A9E7I8M9_9LILI|nr:hypothetical protein MUK42_14141 [Musa troglodytarum]
MSQTNCIGLFGVMLITVPAPVVPNEQVRSSDIKDGTALFVCVEKKTEIHIQSTSARQNLMSGYQCRKLAPQAHQV